MRRSKILVKGGKIIRSEATEQSQFVMWLRQQYPDLFFTCSLAGLSERTITRAKMLGYMNGTPDLVLYAKNNKYYALFIEMKSENGKISDAQKEWIRKLNETGYYSAVVCYGFEQAKNAVEQYLND